MTKENYLPFYFCWYKFW